MPRIQRAGCASAKDSRGIHSGDVRGSGAGDGEKGALAEGKVTELEYVIFCPFFRRGCLHFL